ncbi:MAG: hypothetical protein ACREEM_11730 [Blastocatellia bacterium]
MWKKLYELFTSVITLTQRVEKLERTVIEQDQELRKIWDAVKHLAFEQQRAAEREAHEREKFMLRVENQLLKSGRQLPAASDADDNR